MDEAKQRYEFEKWLREVCFQKPTPEAYDLAWSAWKAAQQSFAADGAWCVAPDCRNPGIYNIWLCGDHAVPPRR